MIKNLNMDYAQKMQRCQEYVEALEEERRKIRVFQRELPLCLELVTQAIEACRRELSGTSTEIVHGQSECSEQTTSECWPVLEEFIPMKRSSSDEDDEQESHKPENNKTKKISENNVDKKKSDWLRSVPLWNQSPDPPQNEDHLPNKGMVVELKRNGGAFQPFNKEKSAMKIDQELPLTGKSGGSTPAGKSKGFVAAALSSTEGTGGGKREYDRDGGEQQTQRKQRRCWSPELHRRFLHALQQLGGSHAATPKQIRELMKVDGLTNDEVKSHLQKYRLHTRKPSPTVPSNGHAQQPQFVVVGGIWVPPPSPAITTPSSADAATTGIYTPVAEAPRPPPSLLQLQQPRLTPSPKGSEARKPHSEERSGRCNSPATSSSTHTTTTSPVS